MIYGGFFGAGTSIIIIFIFVTFFGYRTLEAHATEIAAWIIMSVFSSIIFILHGQVNFFYAAILMVSMGIGSFIGSNIALKGGDVLVKRVVFIFAFAVGLKLLIWP